MATSSVHTTNPDIVRAAVIWTGYGTQSFPRRDDQCVREEFGDDAAGQLLTLLKALEKDFYASDAWAKESDLQALARTACADFSRLHPLAPSELSQVLAWCYTFDYK